MNSGRSILRKITSKLIYLIVVAALVALSLKAMSKEHCQPPEYHFSISIDTDECTHVTEIASAITLHLRLGQKNSK
jgi:hypothetical protein